MSTYIMLADFTDQGIRNISESPKRADAARDLAALSQIKAAVCATAERHQGFGQN